MSRMEIKKAGKKPAEGLADELLTQLLAMGIPAKLRVTGGSMFPAIRSGDLVTLAPVKAGEAVEGDVVLIRDASDRLVLHRVKGFGTQEDGKPLVRTKGDAAVGDDLPVTWDRVLGKVEEVVRRPLWKEALARVRTALTRTIHEKFR